MKQNGKVDAFLFLFFIRVYKNLESVLKMNTLKQMQQIRARVVRHMGISVDQTVWLFFTPVAKKISSCFLEFFHENLNSRNLSVIHAPSKDNFCQNFHCALLVFIYFVY